MNIAIVEDERVAARRLSRLLTEIMGENIITTEIFTTVDEALVAFSQNTPNLIFLDLNLNGEDGFSVLRDIIKLSSQTIVVSANTDRAIEAFELGVLDFIPKPFDKERLQRALNRFTGRNNRINGTSMLVVKNAGTRQFIATSDILYISGAGDYVELHLKNGKYHLYKKSLDKLTETLPKNFIRIHKSHIIDKERIKKINVASGGKYSVELDNSIILPISRTKYKELFSK